MPPTEKKTSQVGEGGGGRGEPVLIEFDSGFLQIPSHSWSMEHLVGAQSLPNHVGRMLTCAGAFWLTYGATLQPVYYAYGNYSPTPGNEAAGLAVPAFNAAFGVYGPLG